MAWQRRTLRDPAEAALLLSSASGAAICFAVVATAGKTHSAPVVVWARRFLGRELVAPDGSSLTKLSRDGGRVWSVNYTKASIAAQAYTEGLDAVGAHIQA
jgi:hypothetical protein